VADVASTVWTHTRSAAAASFICSSKEHRVNEALDASIRAHVCLIARRYHFFDSDALVEQAAGKAVAAIFAEDGEGDFREAESSVMQARACLRRCTTLLKQLLRRPRLFSRSCYQAPGIHPCGPVTACQQSTPVMQRSCLDAVHAVVHVMALGADSRTGCR